MAAGRRRSAQTSHLAPEIDPTRRDLAALRALRARGYLR
jgi:hypothetical protein